MGKESERIQAIIGLVDFDETAEFWDLCCDHGYIGLFAAKRGAKKVVFVDQLKHIMARLEMSVEDMSYQFSECDFEFLTQDVKSFELPLNNQINILAGVGGDLMIEVLKTNPRQKFILNPYKDEARLREYIEASEFQITADFGVLERGRKRPVIQVVPNS